MNILSTGLSSIRARLVLTAGVVLLLFVGAMGYVLYSMNSIGQELEGIAEDDIPLTNGLTEITVTQLQQAITFERAVRYGETLLLNQAYRSKFDAEVAHFNELDEELTHLFEANDALVVKTIADAHNDLELDEFTKIQTGLFEVEELHEEYATDAAIVFDSLKQLLPLEEVEVLIVKAEAQENFLDAKVEGLLFEIEAFTAQAALTAEEHEQTALVVILVVAGIVILLTLLLNTQLVSLISKSLAKLTDTISKVTEGDTEARTGLTGGDELKDLGQELDTLLDERNAVATGLEEQREELNGSIMAILRSVSRLSNGDLTSEAPVNEDITGALGDSINQMTENFIETLEEVNQSSAQVFDASSQVSNMARTGKESVNKNNDAMDEIRNTIQETAKRIKRLGDRSQEIGAIVKVINGISERTSVLALNANMQAAAAGEAGRGFMVVANEVQRLSESSKEATEQISKLVENIQNETGDTIVTMDRGIEEVVKGSELAEEAAEQMDKTLGTIEKLTELGDELKRSVEAFKLPESATSSAVKAA